MARGVKKNAPTETKKVYLYRLNSEGFEVKSGELHKYGYSRLLFKGDGCTMEVAGESGRIFRRTIWFDEPNCEKAKDLFIKYEQDIILQAKRKIEASKRMLENIRKM